MTSSQKWMSPLRRVKCGLFRCNMRLLQMFSKSSMIYMETMVLQRATRKVHHALLRVVVVVRNRNAKPQPLQTLQMSAAKKKYIEKIISDERTNSLIVMANENALETITQLIKDLDVDVDPASRAQIHVVYLEHAKAEDIAQVLSNLSNNTNGNSRNSSRSNSRNNSAKLETTLGTRKRANHLPRNPTATLQPLPLLIREFVLHTMRTRTHL